MREIKFRVYDKISKQKYGAEEFKKHPLKDFELEHYVVLQFTGFKDKNGNEIFESDILTDVVETDEGKINSRQKVFWNKQKGSWHLDNSFDQDETCSTELWLKLHDFQYEIIKQK